MTFIQREKYIDKFIVGVNNSTELIEILNSVKKKFKNVDNKELSKIVKKVNIQDQRILEPFRWNKI